MLCHGLHVLTAFFYAALVLTNLRKPPTGSHGAMGHELALAFLGLCFAVSSGILALLIGHRGGWKWVAPQSIQGIMVTSGWLLLATATFWSAYLKWKTAWNFPAWVGWLSHHGIGVWLPLLALGPVVLLLSPTRQASVPSLAYQLPFALCYGVSLLFCAGLVTGWTREGAARQQAKRDSEDSFHAKLRADHLESIAKHTTNDPIVNIISFTGRFTEPEVRNAALAKFQARPDLEAELIELLGNKDYFYHAYDYIDGNALKDRDRVQAALVASLDLMATQIRESIIDSNNLQDWHFEHLGLGRLLRIIAEQYADRIAAFRPGLQKVLEAFDAPRPERFENVRFKARTELQHWMKAHAKD